MAYSAPLYMEVRWRLLGSDEAWSEPRRVSPVHEVVVEELDRTKQYEFEARNVSACGAKSDWVLVTHTVPDYSPGNINLADLKTEVTDAASEAAQANADLARIASDNMLTIGEKPTVIRDYNVIVTEQAGIDAQAAAFSITTERTAYDAKVTALVNYINTLTSPTSWNDLTGDTTIDGPTLRTVFADVYTSRQTLLNKIYAAAKVLADKAQKGVDDLAAEQYCYNPTFRIGTSGWTSVYNGAGFYTEAGNNSPDPSTSTYLVREGQPSPFLVLMENTGGGLPVREGQGVTASIALRALGTNGGALAYVRIEWLDTNRASIGNASEATGICSLNTGDGYFVQGVSRVKGTAPAGACYAIVTIEYDGHTSGFFTATHAAIGYTAASADEIAEGASRKWAGESGATNGFNKGSNLLVNPTGAAGFFGWEGGFIGSAQQTMTTRVESVGPAFACTLTSVNQDQGVSQIVRGDFSGVTVTLSCQMYNGHMYSSSPGPMIVQLRFNNSSGAEIDSSNRPALVATNEDAWKYYAETAACPSGTASIQVLMRCTGTGNGVSRWSQLKLEVGGKSTPFSSTSVAGDQLGVSGSGLRLGDLRNQVMAGVGNYGAGWSGGTISYSATSSSATITASAATLRVGPDTLAYNQSSTTVSGPHDGNQHTYYLYYDDDTYAGGSKTLHATESLIVAQSANGRLFVGQVSFYFPASGTSGGGGGMTCPDENAWVLRADPNGIRPDWPVRAKTVRAGHYLRLTDGSTGLVTYSERKPADRVRVVAEGASLTCSTSAPLELAGSAGECVLAPASSGRLIKALAEGIHSDVQVARVEDAGPGHVQHITCQNACFWTGDYPNYLFGHHNMKQMEKP